MTSYWLQLDKEELDSLQGIENSHSLNDDEEDLNEIELEEEVNCRRCGDSGCNYCLMLDY
jgi:hypothetical protein